MALAVYALVLVVSLNPVKSSNLSAGEAAARELERVRSDLGCIQEPPEKSGAPPTWGPSKRVLGDGIKGFYAGAKTGFEKIAFGDHERKRIIDECEKVCENAKPPMSMGEIEEEVYGCGVGCAVS